MKKTITGVLPLAAALICADSPAADVAFGTAFQPSTLQMADSLVSAQRANGNVIYLSSQLTGARWYGGLAISGGDFYFRDSPSRPGVSSTAKQIGTGIHYESIDAVMGYRLFEHYSFFLDMKQIAIAWHQDYHKVVSNGLGIGVNATFSLPSGWVFLGTLGGVELRDFVLRRRVGRGLGFGTDVGVAHAIGSHSLVKFAVKSFTTRQSYENQLVQSHTLGGLYLGFQVYF